VITYHAKLGDLIGRPDFRDALDEFLQAVHEMTTDLHRLDIWDYEVKVYTGEVVRFDFHSQESADAFRLMHAEKLIAAENTG
jgi:hypothetical protein